MSEMVRERGSSFSNHCANPLYHFATVSLQNNKGGLTVRSIILPLYQCATPLSLPPIRAPGRVYQSVTSVSLDDRAITLPARLGYMFTDQVNTGEQSY